MLRFRLRECIPVPIPRVTTEWAEDLTGRTVRAPQRFEPARYTASRAITDVQRKKCFNTKLQQRHRCFCCFQLLVFTMWEEYAINTDPSTATSEKVRCFEAGHVYPHSKGHPIIGDAIDGDWNLIPLCHSCNVVMNVRIAFDFIRELHPAHLTDRTYQAAEQRYNDNLPNQLR